MIAQNDNIFSVVLEDGEINKTIEKQEVYSEKEVNRSLVQLISKNNLFEKTTNPFVSKGIYNKVHWIKINLTNQSQETDFIFEFNQTYVDTLECFLVKNKKIIKTYSKQGLHFDSNISENYLSNKYAYLYPLRLIEHESVQLYFRAIINDGAFRVMNKIWTKKAYQKRQENIQLRTSYLLIFSGFVALIIILSLTMFSFSREKIYLYYIGFVVVIFTNLLCLRHLIHPLFVENYFLFGNNFLEMLSLLQLFFMLKYANKFLSLKKNHPKFYEALNFLALTVLTIFVFGLYLRKACRWYYEFSFFTSKILIVVVTLAIYYVAISLVLKNVRMAYYFVIAYFPLLLVIVHYILTSLGLTTSYNPLQLEFVLFFEISVLAIALAHKYFLLIVQNLNYQNEIIANNEKNLVLILKGEEKERSRIARDLHDGVVQQIGSVLLKARNLFSELGISDEKKSLELLENLENSNIELRSISHEMMPRSLKELGLVSAIDDLLNKSFKYTKIECSFENFNLDKRITTSIEIVLYRVLQELVQNIIKHSKANQVNVQLYTSENNIVILVEDNGIGFNSSKKFKGIGLRNIITRVNSVNGKINFETLKGTVVTIKIPKS